MRVPTGRALRVARLFVLAAACVRLSGATTSGITAAAAQPPSDEARAVLERDEGAPQIELCVFLASELEAFRAAMAHALRGVPQTAA